ncbi:MAG: spermidine/putrescine ABC transporter substrate-binding protein [Ruminococcaceae bacterium]|nr:spermidine/putrescine ABC transporter substrate-binding protein [Oscillospiraceae bacterium]
MKKLVSITLCLLMMLSSLVLPGCGKQEGNVVNVYNWGEYIDESIFEEFEAETGITVNYNTFSSNEMLYSSIKSGGSKYDVIIPSDYMVARMISEDLLLKLDYSKIPNMKNLDEQYLHLEFDPQQQYSVPYMWGTTGIIYNTTMVDEAPTSWMDLFTTDLRSQVLIFDNPRDCIGLALKALGYSFNTTNEEEIRQAAELLMEQKREGIVQAYVMDQIFDKMINNEAAIGTYYAGDYVIMAEENPDLAFCLPEEGANLFVDSMCVPSCCENYDNALAFINFMCRDDIVLRNCDAVGYSTPSATAHDIMDPEMAEDPIIYPDEDVLEKCESFGGLPSDVLSFYDHEWIRICLAKVKPKFS